MSDVAVPRGRRLPAATLEAAWRGVAALALRRILDDAGPAVVDPATASAGLGPALGAAIRGTAASTDGFREHAYVPPPSPWLGRHDEDLLRGDELRDLAAEVAVLRAVGIGHDLTRDLRGPGRPDPAALLDAWLRGGMPEAVRGLGFRSGSTVPGGGPAVHAAHPMWGRPGHGSRVVSRFPVLAVDPADAPVAARLRVPGGGLLDLRAHDGGFMRPVLSPGSWEPISLGMFEAAVGRGEPWRDDPYVPAVPRGLPCLNMQDHAGREPQHRDWSPDHVFLEREAGRRAAWRAGLVFLVDDHVWRSCEEPFLTLGLHANAGDGTWRLSWELAGLRPTDDQTTWAHAHAEPVRAVPPGAAWRRRGDAWGFCLGDLGYACASSLSHVSGLAGTPSLDPDGVAVDVDPTLFRPTIGHAPAPAP